jgi:integrase
VARKERRPWRLPNGAKLGFTLRGIYYISRSVQGRKYRITTGCRDPAAALAEYARFEADPARYVSRGESGTSWDEAVKVFIRQSEQVELNSSRWVDKQEGYLANFGSYVRGGTRVFGSLDEFTSSDVRAFLADLTEGRVTGRRVGAATFNRHLATLKAFMGWARRERRTSNVADTEVVMVKEDQGSRFPGEVERARWKAILAALDARWRAAGTVMLGSGLRHGELARMAAQDVLAGAIHVPFAKGRKARTIPVSAATVVAARRLLALGGIPDDEASQFDHRVEVAARRAGVEPFTAHELRHTYATVSLRNGVDLRTLQYRMGHASIRTTEKYLHALHAGQKKKLVGAPI